MYLLMMCVQCVWIIARSVKADSSLLLFLHGEVFTATIPFQIPLLTATSFPDTSIVATLLLTHVTFVWTQINILNTSCLGISSCV